MPRGPSIALSLTLVALSAIQLAAVEQGGKPGPDGGRGHGRDGGGPPPGGPGMILDRLEHFAAYIDSKDDDKEIAHHWGEMEGRFKNERPEEFAKVDADSDGHISRVEAKAAMEKLQAMVKERFPEMFAKIDANGDSRLSREELRAAREKHRDEGKGDKDKEGKPEPKRERPKDAGGL
jgi:hypothetical protein